MQPTFLPWQGYFALMDAHIDWIVGAMIGLTLATTLTWIMGLRIKCPRCGGGWATAGNWSREDLRRWSLGPGGTCRHCGLPMWAPGDMRECSGE